MTWISVKSRPPETGEELIVSYLIDGIKQNTTLAKKVGRDPETHEPIFATIERGTILNHNKYRVTHYMPKPDNPILIDTDIE